MPARERARETSGQVDAILQLAAALLQGLEACRLSAAFLGRGKRARELPSVSLVLDGNPRLVKGPEPRGLIAGRLGVRAFRRLAQATRPSGRGARGRPPHVRLQTRETFDEPASASRLFLERSHQLLLRRREAIDALGEPVAAPLGFFVPLAAPPGEQRRSGRLDRDRAGAALG